MTSRRVLILDDHQADARTVQRCFTEFQHGVTYDVVTASTGAETIAELTRGRPDLIIVEPETGAFDALDILRTLRQHDKKMPIIAVSRGRTHAAVDAVFSLGIFAYVPKPFDRAQLEHLVAMAFTLT